MLLWAASIKRSVGLYTVRQIHDLCWVMHPGNVVGDQVTLPTNPYPAFSSARSDGFGHYRIAPTSIWVVGFCAKKVKDNCTLHRIFQGLNVSVLGAKMTRNSDAVTAAKPTVVCGFGQWNVGDFFPPAVQFASNIGT